ncbi:GNAT family N-acetyltransferase [Entomomonas sp. E2T0]|uniref:GNAT family N-acetyltransferase n=1 Tax=Entomomonas sp. E2T0 TaxID=2930213 RepID=UPI0039B6FC88
MGKLIVHPNQQNQGLGTLLLLTIEKYYPQLRYELFTSTKSKKNLALYLKNGYKEFKRQKISDNLDFVFLEKQ